MRIVVPWPPGGSADMIGRILAEHLGNAFAQSVVVENRPGASGMVGSAAVARSDPDGTTFRGNFAAPNGDYYTQVRFSDSPKTARR